MVAKATKTGIELGAAAASQDVASSPRATWFLVCLLPIKASVPEWPKGRDGSGREIVGGNWNVSV